jgi:hypothetical protein
MLHLPAWPGVPPPTTPTPHMAHQLCLHTLDQSSDSNSCYNNNNNNTPALKQLLPCVRPGNPPGTVAGHQGVLNSTP